MPITNYYVASDAMGSATAILDEEGNVLERRSYDAFGKTTCMAPDDTHAGTSPTDVDVGFQGQISDEVTGLYQMGYRWYNPVLGRWLSRDPIGLKGGDNLDRFVNNSPTQITDPKGLSFLSDIADATIETLKKTYVIHRDNMHLGPYHLNDPERHCFNTGWYRHCVSSCILQNQLSYPGKALDPAGLSGIRGAITGASALAVEVAATTYGYDWPWQKFSEDGDREANHVGIINAITLGPSISCLETCKKQFFHKREQECCPSKPTLKKDDASCCK
jgi:RHS repeat-associated protein